MIKSLHMLHFKPICTALSLLVSVSYSGAQSIIINEVNQSGQWVELYNASTTVTTDVSDWYLCNWPDYNKITGDLNITIISGSPMMTPNSYLVLSWTFIASLDGDNNDGELGLYSAFGFSTAANIRDYMQYGSGGNKRAQLATNQGIWDNATAFVPNATSTGNSLLMTDLTATGPTDTDSNDWSEGMSSQGAANVGVGMPCPLLLALNDNPIVPDAYNAIQITSTGRIADNGNMETSFLAEQDIGLNNPFQVDDGGILIANIVDCP